MRERARRAARTSTPSLALARRPYFKHPRTCAVPLYLSSEPLQYRHARPPMVWFNFLGLSFT